MLSRWASARDIAEALECSAPSLQPVTPNQPRRTVALHLVPVPRRGIPNQSKCKVALHPGIPNHGTASLTKQSARWRFSRNPSHGAESLTTEALDALHQEPSPRRGIPATRTRITEVATRPRTATRHPSPSVSLAGRLNLLRTLYTLRLERTTSSGCFPMTAAWLLDTGSGTAASTCSGRTATADRTLIVAAQFPSSGGLRRSH